jgi:hypothetical protein
MQFKIFNHSQCKKEKYLHLNKLHPIQLNHQPQLVVLPNQKKEREVAGETTMPDLELTPKEEKLHPKVPSHLVSAVV